MNLLRHVRPVIRLIASVITTAALLLWPISYFSYDRLNIPLHFVHHIVIGWGGGDIVAQAVTGNGLYMDGHYWRDHHSSKTDFGRGGGVLGGLLDLSFSHYTLDLSSNALRPKPFKAYTLHVPLWMIAVSAAALAYFFRRRPVRGPGFPVIPI